MLLPVRLSCLSPVQASTAEGNSCKLLFAAMKISNCGVLANTPGASCKLRTPETRQASIPAQSGKHEGDETAKL